MARPAGFLQVDVDGLWAVRRCYGRPEEDSFERDPCWSEGVPRLEQLFTTAGLPAAFFIVGRDLECPPKRTMVRQLNAAGHEIGNHSYTHTLGLTLKPSGFILDEIQRTGAALRALGAAPIGFRSPGYDIDARILRAARRCGYLYDASLLPTHLGPLLRLVDAWMSLRWDRSKRQFGRFANGRAPRHPYFPLRHKLRKPAAGAAQCDILEIPVGTTPTLHLPLTGATLFRLSESRLDDLFARLADAGHPTMLLLHAIDGVDCREPIVFDSRTVRLGGFAMGGKEKERRLARILAAFARHFEPTRADEYARRRVAELS